MSEMNHQKTMDKIELKSFSECFTIYPTNSYSRDKLAYGVGNIKNIHYGDIHKFLPVVTNVDTENLPYLKSDINTTKIKPEAFCRDGDVIMADTAEDYAGVGKAIEVTGIGNQQVVGGLHTYLCRDENHIFADGFRGYILNSPFVHNQIMKYAAGMKVYSITKANLAKILIPCPPLSEQQRIASTLSAVDKAIEQAGIAIEESERMKRGLMKKLLDDMCISSGVCNANKSKLGEVVSLRKDQVSPLECLGMKFVGLEHLIPGQQEVLNYGIIDDQRSLKSRFFEGDVLYGKLRPYLDKGGLASFDGCCSTDILVLIADINKTIPEFISIIIHKTDFIAYAMAHKNGTNHPRTSWNALAKYEFNLPSIENQKRIVNVLKNAELLTISFTRRKSLLETLKRGMMQQLLSGTNQS